ncbi:MAG: acetate/propionate family kinase [Myxococcales bacterium]|nr:acetate/propionate family kinase [Myxococcales bacterium]
MDVLVINCGSSSVKFDVLDAHSGVRRLEAQAERVGSAGCTVTVDGDAIACPHGDHAATIALMLEKVDVDALGAVGHRMVHGGTKFRAPVLIDDAVVQAVEDLIPLAPLHNPANLAGVRAALAALPDLPHVAVFDTAFHATLPRRAQAYAIPQDLAQKHGLRRYGFHGTSHQWVARRAADHLQADIRDLRIITCHLGNGSSVTAVERGCSVETSMGLTPLEGLVMGTRCGDVDPGILLTLMRAEGLDVDGLDRLLNRESGLRGLSGLSNDLRDIEAQAAEGHEGARLAIQVFAHRLRKYIGAYAAVMGGVDAIVFTAGIGEHSALMRHRVAQRLDFLGASLDEDKNRDAKVSPEAPVFEISPSRSRVKVLVVATDEAHAIADAAARLVGEQHKPGDAGGIPIAVSARHIHLTQEAVEILFGEGHELTPVKNLSQPGQYACAETLDVIGPKRRLDGVRVLGPTRPKCQVEISRTDEFHLGLDAPVRQSGHVQNSPGVTLQGPAGSLTLEEGVICAWRHIHMTPADAERFGVKDKDLVSVAVDTEGRDLVFGDVMVRVSPKYALEMHIDTDEANAAEIPREGLDGLLVDTGRSATILRRRMDR